ncbi:MAG: hypothetical protein WBW34_11195 [Nitrososphaeraceae archaeon]
MSIITSTDIEMGKVKVDAYKCERCGHVWLPREPNRYRKPIICARCNSAYWDIPRPDKQPKTKESKR